MPTVAGRVVPEPVTMPNQSSSAIVVGPSRQITALARKAISFQKRQMFTNICCIGLCPFLMVIISAGLGTLITRLISRSTSVSEFLRCSNVSAMSYPGIPNWNATVGLPLLPKSDLWTGATMDDIYQTNYDVVINFGLDGPPGAAVASFQHPCVFWYGENYPFSPLYEMNPGASGNAVRDSTYTAEPQGGWFMALLNGMSSGVVDARSLQRFIGLQLRSWAIYSAENADTLSMLGSKPMQNTIPLPALLSAPSTNAFISPITNSSIGLLGTIPTRYWGDLGGISISNPGSSALNVQPVPWFNYTGGSDNDLDVSISNALNEVILAISKVDKSAIQRNINSNVSATNELFLKIGKILNDLPHGAVFFNKIDHANKRYSWNMHYGTDIRLTATSNFPVPGVRLIQQQTQLDNAILRNSNVSVYGNASITQGLRILPYVANNKLNLPFGGLIGAILYPFGVSFLLPVFCVILVQEKEYRVLVMMQMNGMKSIWYYVSQYVIFYVLFAISTAVFLIVGYLSKLTLFTLTDPRVYIILFFLWGNNQVSLAFLFSTFFNRSRFALVIVFLAVLLSVLIALTVDSIFVSGSAPLAYFIWPPFAFYRALTVLNKASYAGSLQPYKLSMIRPGNEVGNAIIFMGVGVFVYLTLAIYLAAVLPSEFGVRRPWHFPVTDTIRKIKAARFAKDSDGIHTAEAELALSIQVDESETQYEDEDVKAERNRILSRNFDATSPLILSHMRKVYSGRGGAGPKLAVKDVTFAVEEGIVFGLLGPNGAGKTTLISILTGLYQSSSGEATLAGYNIKTDTAEVYKNIGICPQFDILWEELTVSEHLFFYARLKGVTADCEKVAVQNAINDVALSGFEHRISKGLSGGEKRRLSIAIALIGNPKVVFFDEPTTGLDPEVRRLIWGIVNTAKIGKTIVLTTHSMEEAEALCQRIGIMAKGTLRCLANPIRLKQVYGAGFKLYFNTLEADMPRAIQYIESILPKGFKVIDVFATNASYEFPGVPGILPQLFRGIEQSKDFVGILDWGIGQTTLEEVFIRLISESDASAEY
ncbi:hypothetical protein BDV3_000517 [Batrachochytrium dendrobatidis]